jgi:exosome complex component RRP41
MPVAYMPKLNKLTLLQMDGIMSTKEAEEAINLAIEGCKKIYEVQREALKKKYGIDQNQVKPEKEFQPEEIEEEPQSEEGHQ